MKQSLYDYAIYPISFPAEKEITITIRPLGDHVRFAKESYTLHFLPIDNLYSPHNIRIDVTPAPDGCIRFTHVFHGETEYFIRIYDGETRLTQLCVYSLADDMIGRLPFRGDLHSHTCRSDGHESPAVHAANCRGRGLDFLSITDHHLYHPSLEAIRAFSGLPTAFCLVPGEEVHAHGTYAHIINFGGLWSVNGMVDDLPPFTEWDAATHPELLALDGNPPKPLTKDAYFEEVHAILEGMDVPAGVYPPEYGSCVWNFRKIREAGGLAILAHPYWLFDVFNISDQLVQFLIQNSAFDALEVLGGLEYYQENGYQSVLYYEKWKEGVVLPIVGSSDTHGSTENNPDGDHFVASTIVFSPANERTALIQSIKDRYSVAVDTISKEYRLVGESRFQRYACFLMENWFPIHDSFCAEEGHWLKEHLTGNMDDVMPLLTLLADRINDLYKRYFITE